ncbi:MAG: LysR family transcriptional regulator [Lachnospiraceae bacterium]
MELRKLEYFEAVCRNKSFTKAAEELHVAQPSVTVAIRGLEEELGVSLLKRERYQVNMTLEGEIFYQRAIKIINDVHQSVRQMQELGRSSKRILRLGMPPVLGAKVCSQIIHGYLPENNQLCLEMTELGSQGISECLLNGQVDVGFMVSTPENMHIFQHEIIVQGEVHVIMHRDNPLSRFDRLPFEHILQEPQYQLPMHSVIRKILNERFRNFHAEPVVVYETTQLSTVFELISRGRGICFVMHHEMNLIAQNPLFVTRPILDPMPYTAGFFWRKDMQQPEDIRSLIDYVAAHL